ncbi:methionyl-tRNA formyltransferase [Haloarchaeobius litoreus]|uniref:Methionyl-tRNA formyltransferase n=1 Tax=Haloarchaeobius litoreus TaxID=755306 RepID=A0ABD6DFC9_9EURY|nr:formyltransferase family protein [Haloarchaeobius litoreus]
MIDVAFFGSHPLGEACLERLHAHEAVSVPVVVTYPEDEEHWWDGSVNRLAHDLGHDVLPIAEERDVLDYEFDYLLSVYYPNILGPELLEHPDEAAINLHQAELPRYRGSNVFSHSILNAREDDHWKHGTTMHFMAEQVDAGDIIARRFAEITETDTSRTLYEKVRERSIELFEEMLPKLVSGEVLEMGTPQSEYDGERYFYAKDSLDGAKEIPLDELVDGDENAIYDRIRALDFPPFEPAHTRLDGEKVYLTKTSYGSPS